MGGLWAVGCGHPGGGLRGFVGSGRAKCGPRLYSSAGGSG